MDTSLPITQINLALDVIGPILLILVFLGMYIGHFSGNVMTGRAGKRFRHWQWPEHEELPCDFRRVMHLTLVVSMIILAASGLYIRFPFELPVGNRLIVKYIHYIAAFIVTAVFFGRVGYAFLHASKDYREFTLTKRDIKALIPTLKYYAFLAPSKPHVANYNPMQKASYGIIVPILILIQMATGFALWFSPQLLGGLALAVGGLALARVYVRIVHYLVTWAVLAFMVAHMYLAVTEDLPALLYFFAGIDPHALRERRARRRAAARNGGALSEEEGRLHEEHV